jgi:predicted metalloprotease with PDZ domain
MDTPVHYRIVGQNPGAHLFEVTCAVADPEPQGQCLSLPAWIPGSYMIRDFAKHIVELKAECDGRAVVVEKQDKDTWRCAPCQGVLVVRYRVYAWDPSVRAAHLDTTHGFFNGTSMFLRPHDREQRTCLVDIIAPAGEAYRDWRVATALASEDAAPPYGFGRYHATDYDELVDHPVEMGSFTLATFEASSVPHDVAITGRHDANLARLCRDLQTICEHHIRFFGAPAPMERYVFLITAVGEGYGGLEHRASTSLLIGRDHLPREEDAPVDEGYRTFLGLASHEYFHTWNVKRIKPAAFVPYDLSREAYTRQLWAFEGITSYYDDLALVRSGLITIDSYLELLGQTITRVWRTPGRMRQSVAESSFDAWTKFYRQDENAPNAIVSYYAKGALIALALDLTLRRETGGDKSLDDVMRALWERYGRGGAGVPEGGVERMTAEVAGLDLASFFAQALDGTADLPLAPLLAEVGIQLQLRPAESESDKGGKAVGKSVETLARRAVLGVRLAEGAEAKLAHVFDGGAAQAAGLSAGDVIVSLNGLRVTRVSLDKLLARYRPGEHARVHAFRRDELMEFHVTLQPAPADTCVLALDGDADPGQLARRTAWLQRQ